MLSTLMMFVGKVAALEKLPDSYLVTYGNPQAAIKITEFFSFQCPHCLGLFKKEFKLLKEQFLDTNQIHFTFHPVPTDLSTLRAMDCLAKLSPLKKRAFLEVILEEIDGESPEVSLALMKLAMEVFSNAIPRLDEREYLEETQTFEDAFRFLSQAEKIVAVPTVEVNGKLYQDEIPTLSFLETLIGNNQDGEPAA